MKSQNLETFDPIKNIIIKGARVHNLKNIDLVIPRNQLVVITGLSGSGKSSLAFHTIYAEGQRRYVESLSSYARQFLGRFDKPDVDYIKGLSPSIAIQQKVVTKTSRSTVGSTTEISDYLRILFARIGKTISPISGNEVKKHSVQDVIEHILLINGKKGIVTCTISDFDIDPKEYLQELLKEGFSRIMVNGETFLIEEAILDFKGDLSTFDLVIQRFKAKKDSDFISELEDSIETAFAVGTGSCNIVNTDDDERHEFSNKFELDGVTFIEPSINFFNTNSPLGACTTCEGFGSVLGIKEKLVIPDSSLSIYDNAVACWNGDKMSEWKKEFIITSSKYDFPIHKPYNELTFEQKSLLWDGNNEVEGIRAFFKYVESQIYKIQYRVLLSRYRGKTPCLDCNGTKLRKEALYVKVDGKTITDLFEMPISELKAFFENIRLNEVEAQIAKRLLEECNSRISFLEDVGLGYLNLNRPSSTLSGGESQRVHLASSLGSSLVGSLYVLDEPSIGLHSRDTHKLIGVLKSLKEKGNTVLVVEHDADIMNASDFLVDIGPMAGIHGGEIVFADKSSKISKSKNSLTADYLNKKLEIEIPSNRRKWNKSIQINNASEHNLKNISVEIPLETLTIITGVSGSGKSTLVHEIAYQAIVNKMNEIENPVNKHIAGDIHRLKGVEFIDQNPIGKSSRSNPVTFLKAYDDIRSLLSSQPICKVKGFKPSHFSFNVPGGRCEKCEGEGFVTVSMQFMADVKLKCDECEGRRFKDEILEVEYNGKSIDQILNLSVEDAIAFFNDGLSKKKTVSNSRKVADEQKILDKISPLQEIGLSYIRLGQSSSTLSGGEAQRIKLASYLGKGNSTTSTLFIFDEPTTGLHLHDIQNLLKAFEQLIENGNSIWLIEHNIDVIKCADWIIDIGPEGGKEGGNIVFEGTPERMLDSEGYTAHYLRSAMK